MSSAAKLASLLAAGMVASAACTAGTGSSSPSAPPAPAPSSTPTVATGLSATPTPPPIAILPGEPWIAYEWVQDCNVEGCIKLGVHLVRPDGRDHHLLLTDAAGHPDWSPDGQRLAFDTEPADGEEIWTVGADGRDAKLVTCDGAPCGPVASPAWSPDGRYLAFNRGLPREAGQEYDRVAIEVIDFVSGATRVVVASPVAGTEYVEYVGPRWSPDGTQIVFTVLRYPVPPTDENILGSSIAIVKADGSDAATPRILTDPAMFGTYADWSPDGQRIVFQTYPLGSFQETTKATNLYTIRPDGTGLTQVTHFGENDTRAVEPTWAPDGQRIMFTIIERNPSDPSGERLLALIDADGSDLTRIPVPAGVGGPSDWWYGTHARLRPTS